MRYVFRTSGLLFMLLVVAVLSFPAAAQDVPGPGEGGVIAIDSWGVPNFNPLFCADAGCGQIMPLLFPSLLQIDPATGVIMRGAPGTMAAAWTISDDGRVYTFTLRDDRFWSDGVPVTARDFSFAWDVYTSPAFNAAGALPYANVEALDDYTLRVTFKQAECTAGASLSTLVATPAHVFTGVPFSELEAHPFATQPTVTAGPFTFGHMEGGESFTLLPDQTYPDAKYGHVVPTALVFRVVADPAIAVERFLAGELDVLDTVPVSRRADVRAAAERHEAQISEFLGATWDYLAFNLADPTNPQPAFADDGSPIDQGHHPVLGDVRVRQAIARAVDVDTIIAGAVFGDGVRMASSVVPSSWAADPTLQPIPYDPEAAKRLLDEAGWRDDDGDGIREAHSALYAADGVPLRFTLLTNEGNERRTAIGTIIQDQLSQVGIQVVFQTLEFQTMIETVQGQTFDAVILGWGLGAYADPDVSWIFLPDGDVLGYGTNTMSYNNPVLTDLMKTGLTVPGCAPADRKPYYDRIQEIMQNDLPYLWLYAIKQLYAASPRLQGFDPPPGNLFMGADGWWLASP